MVWLGVEEPLRENSQLFALDEKTERLRLADFAESELSRYSFTQVGEGNWPELLGALMEQTLRRLQWVLIWKHDVAGPLRMRSQVRLSRLRHHGFGVATSGSIGVGWLPFAGIDPNCFQPGGLAFHPAGDGAILIADSSAEVKELFQHHFGSATLARAGATNIFVPSHEFMLWMSTVNLRLMYLSYDQLERPGLVVLGRPRLDVEKIAQRCLIERVEHGPRASLVWMGH